MNRGKFKKEFTEDLALFNITIVKRYLDEGYTDDKVKDILIETIFSYYGALMSVDDFANKKAYFIATFANQIIKGNNLEEYIDELCNEIEEEKRISGLNH